VLGLLVAAPPVVAVGAVPPATAATAAAGQERPGNATDSTYSADENTVFTAITSVPDGLVVGGTTRTGDPASGNGSALLRKLADNGTVVWSRTLETDGRSAIIDLAPRPGGGVYALQFTADRSPEITNASLVLHRLDGAGETVWRRQIGTEVSAAAPGILAASERGPAVVRRTRTPNGTAVSLARFTPDGDRTWTRTYDTDARPRALRATDDGYLVAGTASFREPWLLRTDRRGNERLRRTVPGIEGASPVAAVPADDGGVVLAGTFAGEVSPAPWVARLDADGVARWSRVYPTPGELRVRAAVANGDELVLLGSSGFRAGENRTVRLVGVDRDGERRSDATVGGFFPTAAASGSGDRIAVVGVRGLSARDPTGVVRQVTRGSNPAADARAGPERLSANRTYYRGQRLLVRYAPDTAFELVRSDGDGSEVVRRMRLNDSGKWAVDTATLPRGDYYVRSADGAVVARDGWLFSQGRPADARFRLADHRLFGTELDRTLVDRAAGETTATFEVGSDRPSYTLEVAVDRFRGGPADPATLRRLFGDQPGFLGVDTARERPVARLEVGDRERITADASGVEAGLYTVTLRGTDTGVAGAEVTKRIVVGREDPRPLSLSVDPERLSVAVGDESRTNLTVADATGGIAAMSVSAERTGPPAVRLSTRLGINASTASGGAGIGRDRATAQSQAFGGNTAEGTVRVGSLSVRAPARAIDPGANATGTVTLRVDWAVDEDGVPYTAPAPVAVPVEVTDAENATDRRRGTGADRAGGATGRAGAAGGAGSSAR
jgi:hypothetical protein